MAIMKNLLAAAVVLASGVAADGLHERAVAAGKLYFGSATDNGELTDAPYAAQLANTSDFGQITPSNSQKWETTEPSRGTFQFAGGDAIADLAEENGQKLRCHTLVWHSQLPQWVSNGNFDNETLISIMENHVTEVATHFKGRCYAWDVVNEALNEDGTFRESVFYNTIGPAYIPIAFAAAAAADPDAKLYYNDYNLENPGAKSTGAQDIVRLIREHGGRIDGVGAQAHLVVGKAGSLESFTQNLEDFVALDVDVSYTELDIRMPTPPTEESVAQQAVDYSNVVKACIAVERCVGITIWDYTDKYSWIPGVFPDEGAALPWDDQLVKKQVVYDAILEALGPAPY